MQRNQLKFVRRTLYSLKKRYGSAADFYHITAISEDLETGRTVTTVAKYNIRKAILLPTAMAREMNVPGAYRRPDPSFPSNDESIEERFILIDKEDLPTGFEVNDKDYIIVHEINNRQKGPGKRYNIKKITELEDNVGVLITARYMEGGQRNEIFDLTIKERVTISEAVPMEIN